MALPFSINPEQHEALSDEFKQHYVEHEGGFRLELDGRHPDSSRLAEFRTNNIELKRQNEDLAAKLQAATETGKAVDDEKNTLEARLARIEKMHADEAEARQKAERQYQRTQYNSIVRKAARKAGVNEAALSDVAVHLRRQRGMELVDGKVQAKDGTTLNESFTVMRKENPYFFAGSSGGGSKPGQSKDEKTKAKAVKSIWDDLSGVASGKARLVRG